ncbi:ABC transporter permease [Haploplasma axanthum]|uniref:Oligopeptide transport system permease protein oppC n=1 Tax=Haploplasma axanthum TaxID=29552 RepID=A0A449BD20_HAPAX|nr:ABC transporter permease [Haploplasma axanthum]VEU80325.1 Oligopeptide transport system permease protein oppC [Haploplasma axanthum]
MIERHLNEDDFKFINQEIVIKDEALKSKPIGYYQDAWLRFKKNKTSVVAMYIILIMLALTLVGPYFRQYTLPKENGTMALRFDKLPEKVPGLESLGIFDGSKVVSGMSREYYESLPEGIVKRVVHEVDPNNPGAMVVEVDYYRYHRYFNIYGKQLVNGERGLVTSTLSKDDYEKALERNAVVNLVSVNRNDYTVQLDIYRFSFDKDVDDVYFWFGTTENGDDLFTQLWTGSRISILLGLLVTVINITIGVILGSIVGYFGSTLDIIFERIVDVLSNIPFMIVITLLLLRFGSGIGVIVFAFVFTGWIGAYSSTRIQVYRYKNREYVLAARSYGSSDRQIITKHILPNAIGTLITSFSLALPSFIFAESTYSYLGIINYPGIQSVGRLLSDGQAVMHTHFHALLYPALYIGLLMLSFNMFSNGLRDAFNPSLRGIDE